MNEVTVKNIRMKSAKHNSALDNDLYPEQISKYHLAHSGINSNMMKFYDEFLINQDETTPNKSKENSAS